MPSTPASCAAWAKREFRKHGIVATGLNDVMKAAGLTHGGFYKHFA
jgi:TetR/AcrR family transcriptional repressor of nem operon